MWNMIPEICKDSISDADCYPCDGTKPSIYDTFYPSTLYTEYHRFTDITTSSENDAIYHSPA